MSSATTSSRGCRALRGLDRGGEKGLLGVEYYAANPPYPLAKTAGMINLDPHVVLLVARDIELVGGGRTDREARLAGAAAGLGLPVTAEPNPEAGWYFRSGHFPFARKGVPALAFRAGSEAERLPAAREQHESGRLA